MNLKFVKSEEPYLVEKSDDVTVYFNHSKNENDAKNVWEIGKAQVNYENMYVVLYNRYSSDDIPLSKSKILKAGNIKCKNLIVLSDIPYPDIPYVLYIPKKDSDLGQLYFDCDKCGIKRFEKDFDFISFLNK